MIKKTPFEIKNVLDETICFEFKEGIQKTIWTKDNKSITLRTFIDRNIDDKDIFPQYAELKNKYKELKLEQEQLEKYNNELIQEVIRLREKLEPFEKNMGKGRRKGTYKLNDKQIQQVINMYQEGISKRQIAFKFKVSEKTVRNIIKRNFSYIK